MRLEVNKKLAFVIAASLLVFASAFFVGAFGGNNPSVAGHSPGEIDWTQKITSALRIDSDIDGGTYGMVAGSKWDVWIQGGTNLNAGNTRNLALAGRKSDDKLFINAQNEYTGGVGIGGNVIIGDDSGGGDLRIVDGHSLCLDGNADGTIQSSECKSAWPSSSGGGSTSFGCTEVYYQDSSPYVLKSISVPTQCRDGKLCTIVMHYKGQVTFLNPTGNIYSFYEYRQLPSVTISAQGSHPNGQLEAGKWQDGLNGDSTSTEIIPDIYPGSSSAQATLSDDSTAEQSTTSWSLMYNPGPSGGALYIYACTGGN